MCVFIIFDSPPLFFSKVLDEPDQLTEEDIILFVAQRDVSMRCLVESYPYRQVVFHAGKNPSFASLQECLARV